MTNSKMNNNKKSMFPRKYSLEQNQIRKRRPKYRIGNGKASQSSLSKVLEYESYEPRCPVLAANHLEWLGWGVTLASKHSLISQTPGDRKPEVKSPGLQW